MSTLKYSLANPVATALSRRSVVAGLATAFIMGTTALVAPAANAQDYPSKTVTMIVPFVPGGAVDISARLIAESLTNTLGQQFVVENRPGASGSIGYAAAAKSVNDGYTILVGYSTTTACSPSLFPNLNWAAADFAPIASFAQFPLFVTINPSIPANTIAELVTYLKAHPGEVNYGALGVGTQVHIATELFKMKTGTDMVDVQYKGSGDVIADLLSGNIQLVIDAMAPYRQHVQAGTLKTLAVADDHRDPSMPDVPTTAEAGIDGLIQTGYMPLFVPAGTDPAIIKTLADAIKVAGEDATFSEKLASVKLNNVYYGTDELASLLQDATAACADVIKSANIVVQQ